MLLRDRRLFPPLSANGIVVRRALFAEGFRFRLHRKDLPGVPDVVLPSRKVAIFIHGCFWHRHGCRLTKAPSSNANFWRKKLDGNVARDRRAVDALLSAGWRVLTVWECATREPSGDLKLGGLIHRWIKTKEPIGELPANFLLATSRLSEKS